MSHYPVYLDLRGRRCVVLGDNALADEKAATLRASGADVAHLRRPFRAGDLRGAHLAIEASGDREAQRLAQREAQEQRVLLNVVDVSDMCDWIAPAVVRRGPLQIAVSTGGESPFLAATLRAGLERMFGEEWGPFTQMVGTVRRRLRRRGVDAARQRRVYQRLLRSPLRRLLREGRFGDAAALARAIETGTDAAGAPGSAGEVILVGAGPGDPELITVAGREALQNADVVLHDALVDRGLLELCAPSARIVDVGKRGGRESVPQETINALLVEAAGAGNLVVRLKGGEPMLFGRGGEEVEAMTHAGIPVRVIPGVSAALAAPAAAGIPVTHRGVSASVGIVTGRRARGGPGHLEQIAAAVDTVIVLMPMDLDEIAGRLGAVVGTDRPAALISAATLPQQRVVRASLGEIARAAPADDPTPRTLVVGDVAAAGGLAASLRGVLPAEVLPAKEPA